MVRKVNALKVRQNLGQLLEEVYYKGDQYVIERAGRPMAAVVPVWQLKEWQERRARFFGMVDELRAKGRSSSPRSLSAKSLMLSARCARRPDAEQDAGPRGDANVRGAQLARTVASARIAARAGLPATR